MKSIGSIVMMAVACVFLALAPAQALTIDFGIVAPTTGTISFAGGTSPLVGSGISVDNVVDADDPTAVPIPLSNAVLNFTTGNYTGTNGNNWKFGGGQNTSITIVGGIPFLGISDGTTLLSGSFGTAEVTAQSGTFKIAGASFFDTKNEVLLAYFGLAEGTAFAGNFNISFNAEASSPEAFTSIGIKSGDVVNTPVPEASTMILLGAGLLSVGLMRRRKQTRG